MKKILILTCFFFLVTASAHLQAQSLRNTAWKAFIPGLNDTATLYIYSDSSMVTNNSGTVLVRSVCRVSGDTLTLKDYGGPYLCQDIDGVYKIHLSGTQLTLKLINDTCAGRVESFDGLKWIKASGLSPHP